MPGAGDWRNWALLATLGMIWGGSFTLTGVAVDTLPPLTVAAGRLALGAVALFALAAARGSLPPSPFAPGARPVWLFALGVALAANAIPFALLSWAQTHVPSALAGIFMASLPLIVLPLAHMLVPGERLTLVKATGFVVGFVGVIYLFGFDAFRALGGSDVAVLAQLACLGAASGYAVGSILTKLSPETPALAFGSAAIGLAALIMAPIAFLFERPLDAPWDAGGAWALVYLGLAPTAVAQVLLVIVLRRAGPSFLSLVNYQVPLWAVGFGALFRGETIPERALPALALILVGVAISQGGVGWVWRRLAPQTR
ncbi:MAG: DMT family transporter [Pseudomonadota bacterium]